MQNAHDLLRLNARACMIEIALEVDIFSPFFPCRENPQLAGKLDQSFENTVLVFTLNFPLCGRLVLTNRKNPQLTSFKHHFFGKIFKDEWVKFGKKFNPVKCKSFCGLVAQLSPFTLLTLGSDMPFARYFLPSWPFSPNFKRFCETCITVISIKYTKLVNSNFRTF